MKKIAIAMLLTFFIQATWSTAPKNQKESMPINEQTGKIQYQQVVHADGTTRELFFRAVTWMNQYWGNARGMITRQDASNGILEAEVKFDIDPRDNHMLLDEQGEEKRASYMLTLQLRDGRYRYTIEQVKLLRKKPFPLENWMNPQSDQYESRNIHVLQYIHQEIQTVIESMKQGMSPEEEYDDDDW